MYRVGSVATALLAAGVPAACSPMPAPYEATAAALVRTEHVAASAGFSKAWAPLGRNFSEPLSEDDEIRLRFWLDSCVSELTARFTPAPGATVRALQIAECMGARGWHLAVRETSTTGRDARHAARPSSASAARFPGDRRNQ
jgi:hypothetical protein